MSKVNLLFNMEQLPMLLDALVLAKATMERALEKLDNSHPNEGAVAARAAHIAVCDEVETAIQRIEVAVAKIRKEHLPTSGNFKNRDIL